MSLKNTSYFNPTLVGGCSLWLDGADPAGTGAIPANGATVSTWADKSGNSKNMTTYAGTVLFYTSPSRIYLNGSSSLINTSFTSQTYTLFIVYTQTSTSGP